MKKKLLVFLSLMIGLSQGVLAVNPIETEEALRSAVANAVEGEKLIIARSFELTGSSIDISGKKITIEGTNSDVTITAAEGFRVFSISGVGNVTIKNLTLVGSTAASEVGLMNNGGVVSVLGSTVAFENVVFTEGNVALHGGALYVEGDGSKVNVSGSTFTENSANQGGAVHIGEFPFVEETVPVVIDQCVFEKNTSGLAGAMITGVSMALTNSRFEENIATRSSGALGIWGEKNKSTIDASSFINNTAMQGGAISVYYGASLDITNENETPTVFKGNNVTGAAGAIYVNANPKGATANLKDVILGGENDGDGNFAKSGGAIYVYTLKGDGSSGVADLTIEGGSIVGNKAAAGGAITNDGLRSNLEMTDVTVTNNKTTGSNGGTIFFDKDSYGELDGVLLAENTVAKGYGGGLTLMGASSATLTNVTIADNQAKNGGGIYAAKNASLTAENSIIWGNSKSNGEASDVYTANGSIPPIYESSLVGSVLYGEDGDILEENIPEDTPIFNRDDSPSRPYYSLNNESPLLDAGLELGGYTDIVYYTLTYHPNHGSEDQVKTKYYAAGDEVTILSFKESELPIRRGYVFQYWTTTVSNTGEEYSRGEVFDMVEDGNLELYAQWRLSDLLDPDLPIPEVPASVAEMTEGNSIRTMAGAIHIQTNETNLTVQVVDFKGKIHVQQKLSLGETTIPLSTGIYVVTLSDGTVKKLLVR